MCHYYGTICPTNSSAKASSGQHERGCRHPLAPRAANPNHALRISSPPLTNENAGSSSTLCLPPTLNLNARCRLPCLPPWLSQANRQSEPHAHAIVLDPYFGKVAFIPDLGMVRPLHARGRYFSAAVLQRSRPALRLFFSVSSRCTCLVSVRKRRICLAASLLFEHSFRGSAMGYDYVCRK